MKKFPKIFSCDKFTEVYYHVFMEEWNFLEKTTRLSAKQKSKYLELYFTEYYFFDNLHAVGGRRGLYWSAQNKLACSIKVEKLSNAKKQKYISKSNCILGESWSIKNNDL